MLSSEIRCVHRLGSSAVHRQTNQVSDQLFGRLRSFLLTAYLGNHTPQQSGNVLTLHC